MLRRAILDHILDLNQPDFIFNPYPRLAELRAERPIFYEPRWKKLFFTRYEDIAFLLRDKRLGRSIFHVLSRDELGYHHRIRCWGRLTLSKTKS